MDTVASSRPHGWSAATGLPWPEVILQLEKDEAAAAYEMGRRVRGAEKLCLVLILPFICGVFKSGHVDLQHRRQPPAAIGKGSELLPRSAANARRLQNLALGNNPGKCCGSSRFRLRRFFSIFNVGPSRGGRTCPLGCICLLSIDQLSRESLRSLLLNLDLRPLLWLRAAPTCSSIPHSCFKSLPSSRC